MVRYLLRFDDLCPTMNHAVWAEVESLLDRHAVQPMLAIVPDNQDPKLNVAEPDPGFWNRARSWQKKGWIIGLHGYRHVYDSTARNLLPFKSVSEFSGWPFEEQRWRLEAGLSILREQGLEAKTWVAPGHAFDATTLEALDGLGLRVVSDGLGYRACRRPDGFVWIPQQLRSLRALPLGEITFALHCNAWTERDVNDLGRFLEEHRSRFSSDFDRWIESLPPRSWIDRGVERALIAALGCKRRIHSRGDAGRTVSRTTTPVA